VDPVARDAPDLLERGDPGEAEPQPVLAERLHPLLDGGGEEILARRLDQAADPPADGQELVDRRAAAVAGVAAARTPDRPKERRVARQRLVDAELLQRIRRRHVRLAAVRAELAREPLRDDAVDRVREERRRD